MNIKDRLRQHVAKFYGYEYFEALEADQDKDEAIYSDTIYLALQDIERLERDLAKARSDAKDKCVAACKGEATDGYIAGDYSNNCSRDVAVDDCIEAITRALGEKP